MDEDEYMYMYADGASKKLDIELSTYYDSPSTFCYSQAPDALLLVPSGSPAHIASCYLCCNSCKKKITRSRPVYYFASMAMNITLDEVVLDATDRRVQPNQFI